MLINRQWILASRPRGEISADTLELVERPVPQVPEGACLVRNVYLSLDPTNRIWMSDMDQYMPPVQLGEVMRGGTIGRVVESRTPQFRPGDFVQGLGNWQDWFVARPGEVGKVPAAPGVPLTHFMGLLGMVGATAYFGMLDIGQPRPGEHVVVSGAAGAVGSLAAQMAKIHGARVIGIAGGAAKCAWLTGELGLDGAIDYRGEDVLARLRELLPGGVDVYFDNTGGPILDAVLQHLRLNARIPLCGLIATYNGAVPSGPRYYHNILMKRAMVKGFIVTDFAPRWREAFEAIARWHAEGRLKYRVDVRQGLENAPVALKSLFDGSHEGKLIVQVSDERG